MDPLHVLGYLCAALIGVSIGLIGGGGSILTVPVLVYLFGVKGGDATAFSLFIVGSTAAISAVDYARRGEIEFKKVLAFALPSLAAVYLMRRLAIPALPEKLATVGSFALSKDQAILFLFSAMMLAASIAMIRSRTEAAEGEPAHPFRLGAQGFATGLVTGSVGAGGGFLIVPALALVAKMPMKRAVAGSLLVIAINSLIGFSGDVQSGRVIDWPLVLAVAGISIAASFLGSYLGGFVPGAKLKKGFGFFVLAMGVFVLIGEILKARG
jgi:uncharacterized membrane protein YfcA